jgi:hypothetical protein
MMNTLPDSLRRYLSLALLLVLCGCAAKVPPPLKQTALPPPAETSARPNPDKAPGNETVDIAAQNSPAEVLPAKPDPCQQEQSFDTLDAYTDFLRACPTSSKRPEMLESMCRLIGKRKNAYEGYMKFSAEFPDGLPYIPTRHQLSLIGPDGLKVHDCVEEIKQGEETGIILEKVRKRNGLYKDFTFDEIDLLKQMGLTSDIIQAMIESTYDAQRNSEALQRKKEREQQAGYQPAQMPSGGTDPSPGQQQSYQAPASGQGGNLSPVLEAVRNCASQAAALEACKNLSGFARSLCNSVAKSQFPCQ